MSDEQFYSVPTVEEQLDQVAVNDLIQRERLARDNFFWVEMASYYHPDSFIDVSWFQGSGAEFVEESKENIRTDAINSHVMSPAVVTVKTDRAIAETPCMLRSFLQIEGDDVSFESFVRLLWRARRLDGRWLIAGLRGIYVRDMVMACNPSRVPKLDVEKLAKFRLSYRYLSYNLAYFGREARDDLPGIDRPETVTALREAEKQWLENG